MTRADESVPTSAKPPCGGWGHSGNAETSLGECRYADAADLHGKADGFNGCRRSALAGGWNSPAGGKAVRGAD